MSFEVEDVTATDDVALDGVDHPTILCDTCHVAFSSELRHTPENMDWKLSRQLSPFPAKLISS